MPWSLDMSASLVQPRPRAAESHAAPPAAPSAQADAAPAGASDAEWAKVQAAAKNFESYMMSFVFSTAYESLPQNEFSGGMAENMYQNMFIQEAVKQGTASGRSVGLSDMMLRQFARAKGVQTDVAAGVAPELGGTAVLACPANVPQMCTPVPIGREGGAAVTSEFGVRTDPLHGDQRMHHGVDLALPAGSPIRAAADGVVEYSGRKGGYGNAVVMRHSGDVESMYAHNAYNVVKQGEKVRAGQVIGYVGSTGRSTGPHVHFEVRERGVPVNPEKYLDFRKSV